MKQPSPTLTSDQLLDLLARKHWEDVFIPECKTGPTVGCEHYRLDAWAMNRSWSHPVISGYEIKVTRSDFKRDEKWSAYLCCCNCLYFVCPDGLIQPDELPAEVGLIWATKSGSRLMTRKKASYRHVEIPDSLYRYILMSRVQVKRNQYSYDNPQDYWRDWLAKKIEDRELGHRVSRAVRETVTEQVDGARSSVLISEKKMRNYDEVRRRLVELGIPEDQHASEWSVRRTLDSVLASVPPELLYSVSRMIDSAEQFKRSLRGIVNAKQEVEL